MPIRDDEKALAELILFISERSEGDERFGAVKLNKLLFYSDFIAYLRLGKSITGQEYQKLENGPAPRRLLPVREQLIEDGDLALRKVEYFNFHQDRTFALREPDLSGFTGEQIAIVTQAIDFFWDMNAKQMSDLSHEFHGWEDGEAGETIAYENALISERPPTAVERERCLNDEQKARDILAGTASTHDA